MAEELDPKHFELWQMPYSKLQRDRFRDGSLRDTWFARYHGCCFDDDDLRIAANQPQNHFFEWLAAINVYNAMGLHALVEKFESKHTHPRKFEIFEKLMGPDTLKFVLDYGTDDFGGTGCPDLLLYQPDLSDWFFCRDQGTHGSLHAPPGAVLRGAGKTHRAQGARRPLLQGGGGLGVQVTAQPP